MATKKNTPRWSDVKTKLVDFDRAGLLGLLQDLYAANKDNQAFLHARLSLGDDVLKPYKTIIDRWLWPDMFKNQDTSVAKAKKPIADYKKAIGQAEGLAELMVFYCERAAGFSNAARNVGGPPNKTPPFQWRFGGRRKSAFRIHFSIFRPESSRNSSMIAPRSFSQRSNTGPKAGSGKN